MSKRNHLDQYSSVYGVGWIATGYSVGDGCYTWRDVIVLQHTIAQLMNMQQLEYLFKEKRSSIKGNDKPNII